MDHQSITRLRLEVINSNPTTDLLPSIRVQEG
jgi:hypothetical protein